MIVISMFLCVFCGYDLGIPYYGTQQVLIDVTPSTFTYRPN